MLILIWSSLHQDLSICLLNGHGYGLYYQGRRVSAVGTFEYAKRLAECEYVLNNERVFYSDPASGFDNEQRP
jgi:hypothetical protein